MKWFEIVESEWKRLETVENGWIQLNWLRFQAFEFSSFPVSKKEPKGSGRGAVGYLANYLTMLSRMLLLINSVINTGTCPCNTGTCPCDVGYTQQKWAFVKENIWPARLWRVMRVWTGWKYTLLFIMCRQKVGFTLARRYSLLCRKRDNCNIINPLAVLVAPTWVARIKEVLEQIITLEAQVNQFSGLPLQVWLLSKVVPPLFPGIAEATIKSRATPVMATEKLH